VVAFRGSSMTFMDLLDDLQQFLAAITEPARQLDHSRACLTTTLLCGAAPVTVTPCRGELHSPSS